MVIGLLAFSVAAGCVSPALTVPREADRVIPASPNDGAQQIWEMNFGLLASLESDPVLRKIVASDNTLAAINQAIVARLLTADDACRKTQELRAETPAATIAPACNISGLRWTSDEMVRARAAAGQLFDTYPQVAAFTKERLRQSGEFSRYASRSDRDLFLAAWDDAHTGIDRITRVYGLGEAPYFADIDSAIYPVADRYFQALVAGTVVDIALTERADGLVWSVPRRLSMGLMVIHRRDDAPRQAALAAIENAPALARAAGLDWTEWTHSVILVPGHSPEIAYEPLNPNAKLRIRRGVELYRAGKAPFLVVSGGTLRPIGTETNEALAMKQYLMAAWNIPEDAIIIDPVARHTTTNIRNTARIMFDLAKLSRDMPETAMIAGNSVPYIASERFAARCRKELGYLPFSVVSRPDSEILIFRAEPMAEHRDATDPMDP
jgi:hypothetical protein